MFVQIIEGRTSKPDALRQRIEAWQKDVMPSAIGYLGSTGGVTDDGRVFVLARFESAAQAARNAALPQQDAWWRETAKLYDGEVTFRESEEVDTFLAGGSDTAGFVQVMQGKALDRPALVELEREFNERIGELRPDIIGSVRAWFAGDEYAEVVYFTSEAAAREGESKDMPAEMNENWEKWQKAVADVRFTDLREPWFLSP